MARRAASISRAVMRSGSSALRPYSPKFSEVPPLATPWMRPLNCLRNLVRFGESIVLSRYLLGRRLGLRTALAATVAAFGRFGHALILGHGVVFHDFALEDPDLHAAGAVGRLRRRDAVIDIGAQRVQRNAAFAIPLNARDFRPAETAAAGDTNALRAQTHRTLHRAFHHAAERDAALELLCDVFGHQLRIDFRLGDFDDIQVHFVGGVLLDIALQLLDVGTLLADPHAGTGGVDRHATLLVRGLDHDLRHAGRLELVAQVVADLDVFLEELAVLTLARKPARIPGTVDAETEARRIDLLTH